MQKQVIRSQASSSAQGERDTGQTPPYQLQVWWWPDQPVPLVLNGTVPHSPSALVLGTSANSTAKVAKRGKKRKKNKDQKNKAALHPTSDLFQVCTTCSAEQSCQRAGQLPALCSSVPQVPKVFLLLGEAWAIDRPSLWPARMAPAEGGTMFGTGYSTTGPSAIPQTLTTQLGGLSACIFPCALVQGITGTRAFPPSREGVVLLKLRIICWLLSSLCSVPQVLLLRHRLFQEGVGLGVPRRVQ